MFASIGWLLLVVVLYYQGVCVGSAVLQGMHDLKVAVEALMTPGPKDAAKERP